MRQQNLVVWVAVISLCAAIAPAGTIQVGPTRTYKTVAAGYNAAATGDTIEIDSGTYSGISACGVTISKNNLTIRGVGTTRPVLDAAGGNVGDKGIFVVYANNLTVQNLEMKNTVGPSMNDAGIRYQPATANTPASLLVQNCYIHDNQDGILTNGDGNGIQIDIVLEGCEFSHNGAGDGQSHNMYISTAHSFTLKNCYSHDANQGHEVKTRAYTNYILYNLLSSEQGYGSRELQLTQGGTCYVIGNVIQQGPNSPQSEIIAYGGEGTNPNPYLYLVNNTVINQRPNGPPTFITKNNSTATGACLIQNNIFLGFGNETLIGGSGGGANTLVSNWVTTNANLVNIAGHDYHLTAASTGAINMGTAPGLGYTAYSSPIAFTYPLTPASQYIHPTSIVSRPSNATIDIGAYEYVVPNSAPTVNAGIDQTATEGQSVQLHAAASDPDNDPLTYAWTQPAGLNVALSGAATADAGFTAPTVSTLVQAGLTFRVAVADGKGGQANDSVNVRVYMLADANRDDAVDVVDLLTLVGAFGSILGDANYDATCDFNNDNAVDVVDLLDLVDNFGRTLQ